MSDMSAKDRLVSDAQLASLTSLANDLGSLFAARNINGDVVFCFPAEGCQSEERAHRCGACALCVASLLTLPPAPVTHLRRLILAVRSKYFAALLARSGDGVPIYLTDFSSHTFMLLLSWMYTGACPHTLDCASAAVSAAARRLPAAGRPETADPE